ncbi:MAG: radical SAM protein [Eggerthella lenta]
MRVVLSTNGTLITPELAARFADVGLSYVGVSLDGARETHDEFRGLPGSFDRAIEGMRNAKAAGIKVGLRMTVNKRNWREIGRVRHHGGGRRSAPASTTSYRAGARSWMRTRPCRDACGCAPHHGPDATGSRPRSSRWTTTPTGPSST